MCISPITVFVRSAHPMSRTGSYRVPCGKCVQCVARSQNDWRFRLIQQTLAYPKAIFGTLTYSEENVPLNVDAETGVETPSVFKPDVQKWLHRSAMRLKRSGIEDTSYYLTSEYGTSTHRPHYHFMYWNVSRSEFMDCLKDWESRFGFTQCSDIDVSKVTNAAVYVSKYATKGQFEVSSVRDGYALPNFHLVSKGIGLDYLNDLKLFIKNHHLDELESRSHFQYSEDFLGAIYRRLNYITPKGQVFSLPRYYVNKIIIPKTRLARAYSDYVLQRRMELTESRISDYQTAFNLTYGEAAFKVESEKIAENRERAQSLLEKQSRFYYKSKL